MESQLTTSSLVTARVPTSLVQELAARAKDAERSLSAEVRLAIRGHLQNDERSPIPDAAVKSSVRQDRHGAA